MAEVCYRSEDWLKREGKDGYELWTKGPSMS